MQQEGSCVLDVYVFLVSAAWVVSSVGIGGQSLTTLALADLVIIFPLPGSLTRKPQALDVTSTAPF